MHVVELTRLVLLELIQYYLVAFLQALARVVSSEVRLDLHDLLLIPRCIGEEQIVVDCLRIGTLRKETVLHLSVRRLIDGATLARVIVLHLIVIALASVLGAAGVSHVCLQ